MMIKGKVSYNGWPIEQLEDEPAEAVQCKGCEKFALLVKQKNKRIKQLEAEKTTTAKQIKELIRIYKNADGLEVSPDIVVERLKVLEGEE